MAQNDVLLLDSLIEKSKEAFGEDRPIGELFELFCFDQILKDYDLSYEEMETGWVDGGDDGGIDGIYLFLDEQLLADVPNLSAVRRNPSLDVFVLTVKYSSSFQQAPLNKLITSLLELFDFQKDTWKLLHPFRDEIIQMRDLFKNTYIKLASNYPVLRIHVVYACRGQTQSLPENITSRAEQLRGTLDSLFSHAEAHVVFFGASELLALARRQKSYSLRLQFIETNISRQTTNYVVLALISDYYRFFTDETGRLRRYLFESNVRDYLGEVQVNLDISQTLASRASKEAMDFWWLNNGVTLVASEALIVGKEVILDNVRIVNGLQTTETIYRHFSGQQDPHDDRAILVKIVTTDNEEVRDLIIKATNYQNQVELASLRATDNIQRDIEHLLGDHGLYYDRRKNFYKNQGKPANSIVSMSYMGKAVRGIALRDPIGAHKQKTNFMRNEDQYRQVFNEGWPLNTFLASVEIARTVDLTLMKWRQQRAAVARGFYDVWKLHASMLHACKRLGSKTYSPENLAALIDAAPSESELRGIVQFIKDTYELYKSEFAVSGRSKKPKAKSRLFFEYLVSEFDC